MDQTCIVSAPSAGSALKRSERSMGAILTEAGRLKPEDTERILRFQREKKLRFGDAAKALRLLSQTDIDYALSRQFDYPCLLPGENGVSPMVIAAHGPSDPQAETLRALRNEIMLHAFETGIGRKRLAVISAGRQEGRSFIAANLAVVFSQLGEQTLLIDADMRFPQQHELFGLEGQVGLSTVLSARIGRDAVQPVPGLPRLSVLPAGAQPPNPLELLSRPLFPHLLDDLAQDYEVVIIDTPPAALHADARTVAARAGAALIIARRNESRMSQLRSTSDAIARAGVAVIGTVLNEF